MGIRSAKEAIKEARIKAGLTQEEMAEGICSFQALSRIETGVSGVSPGTFQTLMEHAGAPCERYPVFSGRNDFDCFYVLRHAHFYLDTCQTDLAWQELKKTEEKKWANNRLYYQEWLFLHGRLQYYTYRYNHKQNLSTLLNALHVTRPEIDLFDFHSLLLSRNEIQILTAIAQEFLYLKQIHTCHEILIQVEAYLENCEFTCLEKERMRAGSAIVRAKYLIASKEYSEALKTADIHRHQMVINIDTAFLFELTFLTGLCLYYTGAVEQATAYINAAFYSAHAVESSYATVCREYLCKTNIPVSAYMQNFPTIPFISYPVPVMIDTAFLSGEFLNADASGAYTLGDLIRDIRMEQHLSQKVLCQGLCSISKLSKIEKRTLQPDIALTEALLQRLGISERIFTFWGSEKEAAFYDLKIKTLQHPAAQNKTINSYIEKMEIMIDEKDSLLRQECLVGRALRLKTSKEKIAGLKEALCLTLPNFDIHQILRYRLSWQELCILNNIGHEYRLTDESCLSTLYFLQVLEYVKVTKPDILFLKTFLSITYHMHCRNLYHQKLYREILHVSKTININIMKSNMGDYGGYLFLYSQALRECGHYEDAKLAATLSCNLKYLMELYKNTDGSKETEGISFGDFYENQMKRI